MLSFSSLSPDLLCQSPTLNGLREKVVMRIAGNWRSFGLQLDIEPYMLDAVTTPNGTKAEHCLNMLQDWLDKMPGTGEQRRTWSTVLEAVASSCGSEVRRNIEEALEL